MKKYILIPGIALIFSLLLFCLPLPAGQENVTITFNQAKLSLVLQSLSRMTGVKLITSADLGEMPISAYLENVEAEEAIDSILLANYMYREKIEGSKIYLVRKIPEPAPVPPAMPLMKSETFFFRYAKSEDMGKILAPLSRQGEQVIADTRTNSITVRALPATIEEFRSIVASLDRNLPQVMIEAVLVELTTDRLKDLGINWNMAGEFFGAARDVAAPWKKNPTLDIVGPSTGSSSTTTSSAAPQFIMGRLSFETLTASLRILEQNGEANILASPRITALNDTPATIKITRNMAIAPKITETEEGGRTVTEYEYRDVGVTLKVVPHMNDMGDITLDIEPTVSSAARSSVFPDAVDTNERMAKTRVMARDGDTIVIGGLLRKESSKKKGKVPLLGDILPFLFSRNDNQDGKTDLVIFLTPRIITEEKAADVAREEKERLKVE